MTDYINFNLTEYKEFRQLEFDYVKTKDQYQKLEGEFHQLQAAYQALQRDLIKYKAEEFKDSINQKKESQKYKSFYLQLKSCLEANFQVDYAMLHDKSQAESLDSNQKQQLEEGLEQNNSAKVSFSDKKVIGHNNSHRQFSQTEQLEVLMNRIEKISTDKLSLEAVNANIVQKLKFFQQTAPQDRASPVNQKGRDKLNESSSIFGIERLSTPPQPIFKKSKMTPKAEQVELLSEKLEKLQEHLQELNEQNIEVTTKLSLREKQLKESESELRMFKMEAKKLKKLFQAELHSKNKDDIHRIEIDDHNFALDLLSFQKDFLERLFNRILVSIKIKPLHQALGSIYADYEQISEVHRQKLQIEYDLEELERTYKAEKKRVTKESSHGDESLLVEVRSQIQAFRNELYQQKELFSERERLIDERIAHFEETEREEYRMRQYSYELEQKIKSTGMLNSSDSAARPQANQKTVRHEELLERVKAKMLKNQSQEKKLNSRNGVNSDNEHVPNEDSELASIKFKHSTTVEELMKEMIKKDKDNLERVLADNRTVSMRSKQKKV